MADTLPGGDNLTRVLDAISDLPQASQRDLARRSGLSVGLVNLILNRLVQTGRLKVAALDRRRMRYILTPKGLSEKMDRAYGYLLRTCRVFQSASAKVDAVVGPLVSGGKSRFVVLGEGEIAGLVEMALLKRGVAAGSIRRAPGPERPAPGETVLDCRWGGRGGPLGVSILERILEGASGEPAAPVRRKAVSR